MIYLLLALLLLASPAQAAFTDTEKAQVEKLVVGVAGNIHIALGTEVATAIRDKQDPPSLLKPGAAALASASREVSQCLTLLLGQNNAASVNDPRPATRADALAQAWFHCDRVPMFLDQFMSATALAGGANTMRARTIAVPAARAALSGVDRTLGYVDPRPNTRGTLIGPHGAFDHSEWSIWRSWWYMLDSLDSVIPVYDSPGVDAYNFVSKAAGIADIGAHGIARFADIDVTQQEKDNRALLQTLPAGPFGVQFFLLLAYGQVLTDFNIPSGVSGPQFYQQLQDALGAGDGSFLAARSKLTDSWRRMDNATWMGLLVFPGCDMNQNPMGCAAQLPSQQPCPTTCTPCPTCPPPPDPTPVTASLSVAGASVVKGQHTVTAKVTGATVQLYSLAVDGVVILTNGTGTFLWNAQQGTHTLTVTAVTATGAKIAETSTQLTVTKK